MGLKYCYTVFSSFFFFFNCDQSTFRIYVIVFFRLYQRAFTRSCSIESIPSINMEYEIISSDVTQLEFLKN